mmetsp:Transcript_757/g.1221  ORF Transcript_757/g.1221 Transcript_757/m.1221 type:complete len:86 (-) Transcript_757:955-1212(-)
MGVAIGAAFAYIFVDDYLGNEQNHLRMIVEANEAISQLAVYYDFMFISYAAVRRMIYGDVGESWFNPKWINDRNKASIVLARQAK